MTNPALCRDYHYNEDHLRIDGWRHTSRNCLHPSLENLRCALHNDLVRMVDDAVRKGSYGGCRAYAAIPGRSVQDQSSVPPEQDDYHIVDSDSDGCDDPDETKSTTTSSDSSEEETNPWAPGQDSRELDTEPAPHLTPLPPSPTAPTRPPEPPPPPSPPQDTDAPTAARAALARRSAFKLPVGTLFANSPEDFYAPESFLAHPSPSLVFPCCPPGTPSHPLASIPVPWHILCRLERRTTSSTSRSLTIPDDVLCNESRSPDGVIILRAPSDEYPADATEEMEVQAEDNIDDIDSLSSPPAARTTAAERARPPASGARTLLLYDIKVSSESNGNLDKVRQETERSYDDLASRLHTQRWEVLDKRTIPIIIGARGAIPLATVTNLELLGIPKPTAKLLSRQLARRAMEGLCSAIRTRRFLECQPDFAHLSCMSTLKRNHRPSPSPTPPAPPQPPAQPRPPGPDPPAQGASTSTRTTRNPRDRQAGLGGPGYVDTSGGPRSDLAHHYAPLSLRTEAFAALPRGPTSTSASRLGSAQGTFPTATQPAAPPAITNRTHDPASAPTTVSRQRRRR